MAESALLDHGKHLGAPRELVRVREQGEGQYRRMMEHAVQRMESGPPEKVIPSRRIPLHTDIELAGTPSPATVETHRRGRSCYDSVGSRRPDSARTPC